MSDQESQDALRASNDKRAEKGLQPLVWDNDLAAQATEYAQQLCSSGQFQHSGVSGQGENLFWSSAEASFSDGVNSWLGEEQNYHGENIGDGDFGSYGHYTQCMWSSTTNVGIGKARNDAGATYIVGRYTPQGNIIGSKPY